MCARRSNPQYRSTISRSFRRGTGQPGRHETPFIQARRPSGRRMIVATYSGRATAAAGRGAAERAGAAGAVAIRIETARTDRRTRRTSFSVPAAGSAPLVGVVVAGGALAVHRATQ